MPPATIIDFAVLWHLRIRELLLAAGGRKDWELTRLTHRDEDFLPYERALFDGLFHGRDVVKLSDLKYTFAPHLATVRGKLNAEMVTQGWYRRDPARTRVVARTGAGLPDAPSGGLYWYSGPVAFSIGGFHGSLAGFGTAAASTLSSTPPSASGSSGFSGGASGGGGGGGGGGSW